MKKKLTTNDLECLVALYSGFLQGIESALRDGTPPLEVANRIADFIDRSCLEEWKVKNEPH
jgi:hypothetical protein